MPLLLRSSGFLAHWLLVGVSLWIVVGLLGSALSARRGDRAAGQRGLLAVGMVAVLYLAALLLLARGQPARVLAPGQSRCFDFVCFSVTSVQELPGFQARDQTRERLVRVTIAIHNTNRTLAVGEPKLRASLVDNRGHRWSFVPGLAGVSLSTRLQPGGTTSSDPVFRVPRDAAGLHLELLHDGWYPGRFSLGDPESLLHRSTEMQLPTGEPPPSTGNSVQ